ncbi:hypothetical protein ES708_23908 [subsurface metagenome]
MTGSRRVCWYDAEAATHRIEASYGFLDPSKPRPYGYLLPSEVSYAPPGNLTIQEVLPHILDKSRLKNTIILLRDLDNPEYPSFLITTLRCNWFPRGNWLASLYHASSVYSDDYRLIGSITLYIEPAQIPRWLTWRSLARQLRARAGRAKTRRLFEPPGIIHNPACTTIVPLCREVRQHSRLGISESESKVPRGFTPTGETLQSQELTLTGSDGGKLSGMRQSWLLWHQRKLNAVANGYLDGLSLASRDGTGALLPLALT